MARIPGPRAADLAGRGHFQQPKMRREHVIAIVHHEPVRFVAGRDAALHGPLVRRMLRGIAMRNPTGGDIQRQEHAHEPERGRDRNG
jgi:hypothetical protein